MPPCCMMRGRSRSPGPGSARLRSFRRERGRDPSMDAPIMPPRPKGRTTVLNHLRSRGSQRERTFPLARWTRLNTSRQTEATIGTIMMPTISPATKKDAVEGRRRRALKIGMNDRWVNDPGVSAGDLRLEHLQRPEPEDDARDGSTEVDERNQETTALSGAYSVRNSAVPMAIGTPRITAINDDDDGAVHLSGSTVNGTACAGCRSPR